MKCKNCGHEDNLHTEVGCTHEPFCFCFTSGESIRFNTPTETKTSKHLMNILACIDALIDDGFSVNLRKVKGGYFAECHDYNDPLEHRKVYGKGTRWEDAVINAFDKWTVGDE